MVVKEKIGIVVSDKMLNTRIVAVSDRIVLRYGHSQVDVQPSATNTSTVPSVAEQQHPVVPQLAHQTSVTSQLSRQSSVASYEYESEIDYEWQEEGGREERKRF